jgi:hypothetical protein
MTLKGIVRGSVIELEDNIQLAEGTAVEVVVLKEPKHGGAHRRGSAQAVLEAAAAVQSSPEDVRELMRLIKEGRQPADFRALFDEDQRT